MKQLNYELMRLTKQFRENTFATQADRWRTLDLVARELEALGFKNMHASSLKPRHVNALLEQWRKNGLSTGTIKNRMVHLRWWAEKIGKAGMIPSDNSALGIHARQYVANENKAISLDGQLDKITDSNICLSLELQAAFGLRREESLKLKPSYADHGDTLVIKDTWSKGGRVREIPIRNDRQRELLDRAHERAGNGSLIPCGRSYIEHLHAYQNQCSDAGIRKMSGLRHTYAQERYRELTGRDCPARGGPLSSELEPDQKLLDQQAREIICQELGIAGERSAVLYLGR